MAKPMGALHGQWREAQRRAAPFTERNTTTTGKNLDFLHVLYMLWSSTVRTVINRGRCMKPNCRFSVEKVGNCLLGTYRGSFTWYPLIDRDE